MNLNRSSSYLLLCDWIANKKAIINPRNEEDEECVKRAVIAALHHKEIGNGPQRISKLRRLEGNYEWGSIPIALDEIDIFERKNDVSVNVLATGEGKEKLYVLRKSKFDCQRTTTLVLIANDEKKHYAAIKNLSRLLRSSTSKHCCQQHFCPNCLQGFHSKESRDRHYEYCVDNEAVRIDMPEENSL